jgi:hypothetical protein
MDRTRMTQWPELPLDEWQDTYATLHMYTQIIGKVRLALAPKENQWWHVPLYVNARGLTTSPMPLGERTLEIAFDFLEHNLVFESSDGERRLLALLPRTVAHFYADTCAILEQLGVHAPIYPVPVEVKDPIPFAEDSIHRAYDSAYVERFFHVLARFDLLFKRFRAGFRGKCSPVHFFWGSFDLAVTRFSGRRAPARPGADPITAEAYDEEVSSLGFWPGDAVSGGAALYAYFAPEPAGFASAAVRPAEAAYSQALHEFLLLYDAVRHAADPDAMVLAFAESTYDAGAALAGWDREALAYLGSARPAPTGPPAAPQPDEGLHAP